jgi:hypothetical protein
MDALKRADQVLARASARRADIVTPDSATSVPPGLGVDTMPPPRGQVRQRVTQARRAARRTNSDRPASPARSASRSGARNGPGCRSVRYR